MDLEEVFSIQLCFQFYVYQFILLQSEVQKSSLDEGEEVSLITKGKEKE